MRGKGSTQPHVVLISVFSLLILITLIIISCDNSLKYQFDYEEYKREHKKFCNKELKNCETTKKSNYDCKIELFNIYDCRPMRDYND